MEEIIFTIQEGEIKVEVSGVKGARCLQMTKVIEALIGKVEGRTFNGCSPLFFYNYLKSLHL